MRRDPQRHQSRGWGILIVAVLAPSAVGCVPVPDFQCWPEVDFITSPAVPGDPSSAYGEQCPERLAYRSLFDGSARTLQQITDGASLYFGNLDRTAIKNQLGQIVAYATFADGMPPTASVRNGQLTFLPLAPPGPLQAVVNLTSSVTQAAGTATGWRWDAVTPVWIAAGGYEWMELTSGTSMLDTTWTYKHVDAAGTCYERWRVTAFCINDPATEPGLLP